MTADSMRNGPITRSHLPSWGIGAPMLIRGPAKLESVGDCAAYENNNTYVLFVQLAHLPG